MPKPARSGACLCWHLLLIAWLHLHAQVAAAQVDSTQAGTALQRVGQILRELDLQATACLAEAAGSEACRRFLLAVDGQPLAEYLDQCSVARSWRDDLITNRAQSDTRPADNQDSARLLDLLVDFEFFCGQDALERATRNTVAAYRLTRSATTTGAPSFRPDDWQQQRLLDRERDRQQQAVNAQREQMRQQMLRQFNQLELEILRQQAAPWSRR